MRPEHDRNLIYCGRFPDFLLSLNRHLSSPLNFIPTVLAVYTYVKCSDLSKRRFALRELFALFTLNLSGLCDVVHLVPGNRSARALITDTSKWSYLEATAVCCNGA